MLSDPYLRFDEIHELVRVLADDDRAEVTGDVVPGDAVSVPELGEKTRG